MAALITMGLIGFLTSFFSKNMIVILCVALTLSTILKYGIQSSTQEGLTGADEDAEQNDDTETDKNADDDAETDKNADEGAETGKNADEGADKKIGGKMDKAKMKDDKDMKEVRHAQEKIADSIKQLEPFLDTVERFMNNHA